MKKFIKRLVGFVLLVAGLAGVSLVLLAGFFIWNNHSVVTQAVTARLELANQALTTTDQTLSITKESMNATLTSLITAQQAISATAATMQSVDPLVRSTSTLLSDQLPQTVKAARESLLSAQVTARLIDDVLRALTIFNQDLYKPAVPLNVPLQQLADSLVDLPQDLTNASLDLRIARNKMEITQESISAIVNNLELVKANLAQYTRVIDDYRTQNLVLQQQVADLQAQFPGIVRNLMWGILFLLALISLAQFGLMVQGIQLLFG